MNDSQSSLRRNESGVTSNAQLTQIVNGQSQRLNIGHRFTRFVHRRATLSVARSMMRHTARPTQSLAGFGPDDSEKLASFKALRTFVVAIALLASGCSGGGGAGAPITPNSGGVPLVNAQSRTPSPSSTPIPAATLPTGSVLWHLGDAWGPATGGQCNGPTFPSSGSADFVLNRTTVGGCYRNQLIPRGSSGTRLSNGTTYTWRFQTTTHMGLDAHGTQRLIWQIHGYNDPGSPLTVLGIQNLSGTQQWYLQTGGGTWTGAYTEGGTDTWEITATISTSSSGHLKLVRNGATVFNVSGATYNSSSQGNPWWNFGPYMWDWTRSNFGGSHLTSVKILFTSMMLTSG